MSTYLKKNDKSYKKNTTKQFDNNKYIGNLIGSRKIIKETKEEFINKLYTDSDKYKRLSRSSNTVVEHEVNKALSLYAKDVAELLDVWFDKYKIV